MGRINLLKHNWSVRNRCQKEFDLVIKFLNEKLNASINGDRPECYYGSISATPHLDMIPFGVVLSMEDFTELLDLQFPGFGKPSATATQVELPKVDLLAADWSVKNDGTPEFKKVLDFLNSRPEEPTFFGRPKQSYGMRGGGPFNLTQPFGAVLTIPEFTELHAAQFETPQAPQVKAADWVKCVKDEPGAVTNLKWYQVVEITDVMTMIDDSGKMCNFYQSSTWFDLTNPQPTNPDPQPTQQDFVELIEAGATTGTLRNGDRVTDLGIESTHTSYIITGCVENEWPRSWTAKGLFNDDILDEYNLVHIDPPATQQQPIPWHPKRGDMVEASDDGNTWYAGFYVQEQRTHIISHIDGVDRPSRDNVLQGKCNTTGRKFIRQYTPPEPIYEYQISRDGQPIILSPEQEAQLIDILNPERSVAPEADKK